jgi:putative DNA primase/helicase
MAPNIIPPTALAVSPRNIPADIQNISQWVVWRYEWLEDKQKWTKVPYRANDPTIKASSTHSKTWVTFEQALATYQAGEVDGIGFVLTTDLGLVGIDLDHCRDPDSGEIDTWAVDIMQAIASYTEVSPSGTGLRLFARGTLPGTGRKVGDREIYASGRYLTITGCHLQDTPQTIEACQPAIEEVYQRYFPRLQPRIVAPSSNGAGPGMTDEEVLALARQARNGGKFARLWVGDIRGYPSPSEADLALCILLAFWTRDAAQIDRLFRQSKLTRPKWEQRHGEHTYGAMTIVEALRRQTENYHERKISPKIGGQDTPHIRLTTDLTVMTDALQDALLAMPNGPRIFQRARQLCLIGRGIKPLKWLRRPAEAPVILPMPLAYLA